MCFVGGVGTSGRGDEGGFWTFERADCGCGGEVGGAAGWFLSLSLILDCFFLVCCVRRKEGGRYVMMFADRS